MTDGRSRWVQNTASDLSYKSICDGFLLLNVILIIFDKDMFNFVSIHTTYLCVYLLLVNSFKKNFISVEFYLPGGYRTIVRVISNHFAVQVYLVDRICLKIFVPSANMSLLLIRLYTRLFIYTTKRMGLRTVSWGYTTD